MTEDVERWQKKNVKKNDDRIRKDIGKGYRGKDIEDDDDEERT